MFVEHIDKIQHEMDHVCRTQCGEYNLKKKSIVVE